MMSINNVAAGFALIGAALVCHAGENNPQTYNGYGVSFSVENGYFAYLDEKPCALDEKTTKATVYSAGLYQVVVYTAGKVSLMKQGVYLGDLHRA